jgi:hypothetical protein
MYVVNSVVYLIIGGAVGDVVVTLMRRRRTIKTRR